MWGKNKRKLEFGSNADAGRCCYATGTVKGVDRLTASRKVSVRSQEMKWFGATRNEGRKRKENCSKCVCKQRTFHERWRVAVHWTDWKNRMTGWIMDLKFKILLLLTAWFYFEKWLWKWHFLLQQIYKQCLFCVRSADLRRNPPLHKFFLSFFLKKQHLFFVSKLDRTYARKKKTKARLSFLYYIGLVELLRLNYILLLRSPVRHGSWRHADCRLCCLFGALFEPP